MFKIIKMELFDTFQCWMSDCPANCCDENWNITIDDQTMEKYRTLEIPELSEKISSEPPHRILKKDGKCPFIEPSGLCMIHRTYGEAYLSNTCASYPRFVSMYGDVYMETLGLSCPAVVKQVYELPTLITYTEQMNYEKEEEIGQRLPDTFPESLAKRLLGFLNGEKEIFETYSEMYAFLSDEKAEMLPPVTKLLTLLRDGTSDTPVRHYVEELYPKGADLRDLTKEKLLQLSNRLEKQKGLFAANCHRILCFEHMMLESLSEEPDYPGVLRRNQILWELVLTALFQKCGDEPASEADVTETMFKVMRVLDHNEKLLPRIEDAVSDD